MPTLWQPSRTLFAGSISWFGKLANNLLNQINEALLVVDMLFGADFNEWAFPVIG
jgi:hypothetical protein